MAQTVQREDELASIAPLRKRKRDGTLYVRPEEVEKALSSLSRLAPGEVAERARIDDPKSLDYVTSECVLYFVRNLDAAKHRDAFRELFAILRQRVLRAVPVRLHRAVGSAKPGENAGDSEVRDLVLQRFQEILCRDREDYDARLDFYECRFNSALACLRATARREVRDERSQWSPMPYVPDTNEFTTEVEAALEKFKETCAGESFDSGYRSRLLVAISSLPPDERRVIELLLEGVPIDSGDKEVFTIRKALQCAEKTVRNRRDRAIVRLRDALKAEEDL